MAVHDYYEKVTDYLKVNFAPCEYNTSNVQHSNLSLLKFLYTIFPKNCISEYELHEIMVDLGYRVQTWPADITNTNEDGDTEIKRELAAGWCMRSPFELGSDFF
jgi:hypothetical protein